MKLYHFLKGSIYAVLMSFIDIKEIGQEWDNATSSAVQEKTKFHRFFLEGRVVGYTVVISWGLNSVSVQSCLQSHILFEFYNPKKTNNIKYSYFLSLKVRVAHKTCIRMFQLQVTEKSM